jgi:hypothetical protein
VEGFPGKFDKNLRSERRELECQEVTEQAPLGVAVQVLEEVLEWAVPGGEEWGAPKQAQDQEQNVCAQNAQRLLLIKQERRATL